jgi:SpoIID/LytB domain protein
MIIRAARSFLAVVLVVSSVGLPAGGASAQEDPTYQFTGAGWGHGVGLPQYGARAMAEDGMTADQILSTYYTGVGLNTVGGVLPSTHWLMAEPAPLWIGLGQNQTVLRFSAVGGTLGLCKANDGEGACPTQFANPGESWELRALGGGACQFFKDGTAVGNPGTCRAAIEWTGQPAVQVSLPDLRRTIARGTIRVRPVGEAFHVVLQIGLEEYLYGIGEVPSSWPEQALQAQAIAARTYGVRQALRWGPEPAFDPARQAQCWCQLYATVVDQNYVGWAKEAEPEGVRWVSAINATAGRVVTHPQAPDATVIIGYYFSSSGGHTDSNVAGLGQATLLPYLPGVPDPWSVAPEAQNPFASWTKPVTASAIAGALGMEAVTGIAVTKRNISGSVAEVAIAGTVAGAPVTITRSGRSFRSALGLRSLFFDVVPPSGALVPVAGAGLCDQAVPSAAFTDVTAGPHRADIDCIASLGITTGISPGVFGPTLAVTRWQMALFLTRTAARLGVALPDGSDRGFTDLGGLSADAVTAINRLAQLGITTGTAPGVFDPLGKVTRWQMALFLMRLHGATGFEAPAGSQNAFADLGGLSPEAVRAVNQLAELGVTTGTGPNTFGPSAEVTREQMASFLARLIRLDS